MHVSYNIGYAVVSSVRLRLLTRQSASASLDLIAPSDPIHLWTNKVRQSFTSAVGNCPSDESNIIRFNGDHFSRGIISYDSWGIRLHERGLFHTFRLIRQDQS